MPTNRKRRWRASQAEPWKIEYMLHGRVRRPGTTDSPKPFMWGAECFANTYPLTWDEMRDELLAEWIREHPGTRPFAWWECDAPGPRREGEPECAYLKRLNLLSMQEKRLLLAE